MSKEIFLEKVSYAVCDIYASEWNCEFYRTDNTPPASFYDWELSFKQPSPRKYRLGANLKGIKSIAPISGKMEFDKNRVFITLNNKDVTVLTS